MISSIEKTRSRQYPAETIIDEDYIDNQALLENASGQAK